MLMIDVRVMRMAVGHRRMGVLVRMRLAAIPVEIVRVLVVFIVHVAVRVGDPLVGMQVLVTFGHVQPHARAHQDGGNPEHPRGVFAERQDRDRRADERRGGEIRARARRTQTPQAEHEQCQADAIADQSDRHCHPDDRHRRQACAERERDRYVDDARGQSFQSGDEQRVGGRVIRIKPRPIPLPRYNNPASNTGDRSRSSALAKGVLAPNSNAAPNAAATDDEETMRRMEQANAESTGLV